MNSTDLYVKFYKPRYYTIQQLVCPECKWKSDFRQIFRDCGFGDGEMIDGPEWNGKCPKCKIKRGLSGHIDLFWTDENEGVLFVWGEKEI